MDKICIGIPVYGQQSPLFWIPFARLVANLHKQGIEFVDVLAESTMKTDRNRNVIIKNFLTQTDAEWLFWIDADNVNVIGSLRRLLDTAGKDRTLVAGLYYTKSEDNTLPVALLRNDDGTYTHVSDWVRGEIIPIDASGFNCVLSHRSVYEDIQKNYVSLQLSDGGRKAFHRDDISGDIADDELAEDDNKIVDGVWKARVMLPTTSSDTIFTSLHFDRTEDFDFFEKAARCGHQLWLDTSVECGHIMDKVTGGKEYRERVKEATRNKKV
jgi:hypothetical protein